MRRPPWPDAAWWQFGSGWCEIKQEIGQCRGMRLETKDLLALGVSSAALAVSFATLYFAQIYKPARAMLLLLDRRFSPAVIEFEPRAGQYVPLVTKQISPQFRHLYYTLSNTGKQTLYVKSVEILRGPHRLGHMFSNDSFEVLHTSEVESCLLDPGEILPITIEHPTDFKFPEDYDFEWNCHELVSVELIAADGSRYQVCHDISELGSSGPHVHHPIWDGVALGSPVRGSGFYL
ncbi:hypothetical protein ACF8R6_02965 [Pseudomonas sp. CJQ_7]|uniref:hypothetical protein n=1 Tax=Pseudomonas sp. CJQ_7 TaxID=3367166 RepID=UPI00370C1422